MSGSKGIQRSHLAEEKGRSTYVVSPFHLIYVGVGVNDAIEVYVSAFSDIGRV